MKEIKINHLYDVQHLPGDVEINFAVSNMAFLLAPDELPFGREAVRTHGFPGDSWVGSRHLLETLSRREGVPPENILLSLGASMANFLVWSVLLEKGDEVLVEFPAYEPLIKVPQALGARVRFLKRAFDDFALTPAMLEKRVSAKTRMIIISDSHNPSGNQLAPETLQALQALARKRNIWVCVDEIYSKYYREQSLAVAYPEFIVTGSLTKFYGLGDMRIGWAFAPAEVIERARNYQNHVTPVLPFTTLYLAQALLNDPIFAEWEKRIRQRVRLNRDIVSTCLDRADFLTTYMPKNGILFFPQLKKSVDAEAFHRILREKYHTLVTCGDYFRMPRHFRIAAVWDEETMREGLRRLDLALREAAIS